jgi:hypothetical protein
MGHQMPPNVMPDLPYGVIHGMPTELNISYGAQLIKPKSPLGNELAESSSPPVCPWETSSLGVLVSSC